ncbi:ribosomal protein S18-alanine N-acetyltransferase [Parerythrobacter aestuarii]|uniref:ribosomal protein S18-alanine N-acetyltransferase n=1 Tax=Parerythrobacter aestuarii TaxID=3020909 RepID=UPI0024DE31F5|nr:ribosomal protein S18-alanine N-acetyltransferase [Parerythrobacter aestuarii]
MMDDLDRIMAVMESAFDPQWGEAWTRRQVETSLVLPTTHYRLIAADGKAPAEGQNAAGFAMTRAAPGEEELLLIAVLPSQRGKGLGGKLLDILSQDARSRGASKIFLEMRENNPAQSLYHKYEFNQIGRRKDYYTTSDGSRMDALTFVKTL